MKRTIGTRCDVPLESVPLHNVLRHIFNGVRQVECVSMTESWELGPVVEDYTVDFIPKSQRVRIGR